MLAPLAVVTGSLDVPQIPSRSNVISLVQEAMQGRLVDAELQRRWPRGTDVSRFLSCVREDVEDSVHHFPGTILSGRPVWDYWYKSEIFGRLVIDELLLTSKVDDEELGQLRDQLIWHAGSMVEGELRQAVTERLGEFGGST